MRKELGKPTRELFFRRLGEVAPKFQRCGIYDIKGFTWSFLNQDKNLYQWICFQRHKYENAFTIELAWRLSAGDPCEVVFDAPTKSFSHKGNRFRLGGLWGNQRDYWWYVTDPLPDISTASMEDYLQMCIAPPEIDIEKALPRIHAVVDDAISRIQNHALPYFEKVSEWVVQQDITDDK
ncbi:MAG: hypothetical protein SFY80_08900 [Verrucomicrobiota bacterium]|nr:hypothetical protein [Verrucomicrobiota bacterium]